MPVFSSLSAGLAAVTANGQLVSQYKDARVGAAAAAATVAGQITSLWQYNGSPSNGAVPTSVVAPTSATAGALGQADAGGSRSKYLTGVVACCGAAGSLLLYDRLLHIGGLSGTSTGAQTVAGSLTRNTGGTGNQIWVEVYTQIGSTGTTIHASYTNQGGSSGQTSQSVTIGGTGYREAQRIIPIVLASGDYGVQAVASVTLAASTLTAGNFGITVLQPIAVVPLGVTGPGSVRTFEAGIPDFPAINPGACLAWAWLANTTTIPQAYATCMFAEQ